MGEPLASESGWKMPLDQSVAKLPLTAPEPKAVLLERCLARAEPPQLLPFGHECRNPLPKLLDSGPVLDQWRVLGRGEAHRS